MKSFVKINPDLVWGGVATALWALVLCSFSASFGPVGVAPGIEIGPWIVGRISRYFDPFILGPTVSFAIWAWKHAPPAKRLEFPREDEEGLVGAMYYLLIILLLSLFGIEHYKWILAFMLVPFGKYGLTVAFPLGAFFTWVLCGLTAVVPLIISVFVGKWLIWWIVKLAKKIPDVWKDLRRAEAKTS